MRAQPGVCVIFDLDGTLVDSELLGNQAYAELLPQLGETGAQFAQRYRGWQFARIAADLEARLGAPLPADFETRFRARAAALFEQQLEVIPHVPAMLDALLALGMRIAVASNAPPAKIAHVLQLTGLAGHFGAQVYSAYTVGSWKPDPGLFVHAAQSLGFAPARCAVVEDSATGIAAAAAAGMPLFHYCAHETLPLPAGATAFADMRELPLLLQQFSTSLPHA